jgi:molybdopterin biosynthesis enzyme
MAYLKIFPLASLVEVEKMAVKNIQKETIQRFLGQIEKGPRAPEEVFITSGIGRVLFADVSAIIDDPPYSNSTAEGYLLLASGTALASPKRPMLFESLGDIPIPSMAIELPLGKTLKVKRDSYMAIKRFMEGHYAVIKDTEATFSGKTLEVTRLVEKFENIILQGSVRKVGNTIFKKGYKLTAGDIITLAHQGILKVTVSRKPTVALFSTGRELIAPATPYTIGSKYDCNSYCLSAMIEKNGGNPLFQGIMPNDLLPFIKKLVEVAGQADMVVLSGATVALDGNFMSGLIKGACSHGVTNPAAILEAHRRSMLETAIKPNFLGIVATKPIICLAGNPDKILEGFEDFVAPVLSHLLGEQNNL